jgi:hypothetical protein
MKKKIVISTGFPFGRHCEQSEAIQNSWIAAPLPAARDDMIKRSLFY